jgi:hypothetical protein
VAEAAVHVELQLGFEQHLGEDRIVLRPREKPARSQPRVRSGDGPVSLVGGADDFRRDEPCVDEPNDEAGG